MNEHLRKYLGELLGPAAQHIQSIRLGRGVLSKTGVPVLALLIVLGIVAWRVSGPWKLVGVGAMGFAAVVIYLVFAFRFADKHTGAALLEGADLLTWQSLSMAAKDPSLVVIAPPGPNPALPASAAEQHQGGSE